MEPVLTGISQSIQKTTSFIHDSAGSQSNILIIGESGVGKEWVAQILYRQFGKADTPFVKIDCAALAGFLECGQPLSELPGFQDVVAGQKNGTPPGGQRWVLLLDRIDRVPLILQSRFVTIFQPPDAGRLRSEKSAGNRIIATSCRDFGQGVDTVPYNAFNFRKIHIPPLRQRPEDIVPLVQYYLRVYAARFGNLPVFHPTGKMLEEMTAYPWPGNIRELRTALEKLLLNGTWAAPGGKIGLKPDPVCL